MTSDRGRAVLWRAAPLALIASLCLAFVGCGQDTDTADQGSSGEVHVDEARRRAAFFRLRRQAAKALQSGDREEAVRLFRKALESKSDHEGCLVDLAQTLRELNRPDEALEVVERLKQVRPDLPRPYFLMAEVLSGMDASTPAQLEQARALYQEALELEPNVSGPRLALARVELRLGNADAAEAAYRSVLGTNPDSQEALNGLGEILVDGRRAADAVPMLVRSLEIGTRAKGRRDVPSEMDTASSFDAGTLDAAPNQRALKALARAAKLLGGYPESVPARFRLG